MDGLGLAVSVGGLIGLAGQIAQGVRFLHTFFSDIKDAPADIEALVAELTTLRLLLNKINPLQGIENLSTTSAIYFQKSTIPTSSQVSPTPMSQQLLTEEVQPALDHCKLWVNKLEELVLLYEPSAKISKGKRLWAQINIALRNKKFKKYVEGLERAKSMLQQAQIGIITNHIATTDQFSAQISSQLTALTLNQSLLNSNVTETMSAISSLEHNVDNLKSAVHSSLAQISSNGYSSRRPPMMEEYVASQIREELGFSSLYRPECGCSTTKSALFNHDSARNQKRSYQKHCTTLESPSPISGRCERTESSPEDTICSKPKRHLNTLSSYKTLFGTISRSTEERGMTADLSYLITEIVLLPASWLLRTGFAITITRIVSAYTRPTLSYTLRPIEIITNTNCVLGAMLEGDLLKVQNHFTNRVASPFATFSNGVNLLHVLTCIMFNVSVGTFSYYTELDDWSDISGVPLTEWGQQDPRHVRTQWENYKSMFTWLRSLGVDVGAKSDSGRTPMQCLFRILRLDTDSFDEENLFHLAISSIEAAKNNPRYAHHSGEIGGILRKCLRGGELSSISRLSGRILEHKEWTICTDDDGQCVASTVVLDDTCPPLVAESPDWKIWIPVEHKHQWSIDLFSHLSQDESRLIKKIVDGIPTSKNSELDPSFANAIAILFRTITTALLRGSPLKAFDQCYVDKGLVRQSIIEDVAFMMPADPLLTTFHFDGDTLAMWAQKWRVLDLWREALFKRGFGSADVDWLTGKAWREDKHLYHKS